MQTYQEFLQSNFKDRTSQKVLFDTLRKNDARFRPDTSGLSDEQAATIMADVTGFEPLRRFSAGRFQQTADAVGEFSARVGDIKLSDFGVREATEGERTFREVSADAGSATAKFFGAGDETAELIGQGAGELPNIAALMGMGVVGTMIGGPAALIGTGGMMASMYGQGVTGAHSEGITGGKAVALGAVGPAVSAVTIGLARPLANKAAGMMVKSFSGTSAKAGITEAAKDLAERGGSKVLQEVIQSSAVPMSSKVAMKLGQELMVEASQSAIGVGGEVISELIRDPKDFLENGIKSKEFWIPALVSESIEGIGGTVIGRLRDPIKSNVEVKTDVSNEPIQGDRTVDGDKLQADFGDAGKPVVPAEVVDSTVPTIADALKPEALKTSKVVGKPAVVAPEAPLGNSAAVEAQARKDDEALFASLVSSKPVYTDQAKTEKGIDPADEAGDAKVVESVEVENQIAAQKMLEEKTESRKATFVTPDPLDPSKIERAPGTDSLVVNSAAEAVDAVARVMQAEGNIGGQQNPAIAATRELGDIIENGHPDVEQDQRIASALENMYQGSEVGMKDHRINTDEGSYIAFRNPGTQQSTVYVELARTVDGKQQVVSNRALQQDVQAFTLDADELLAFSRDPMGQASREVLNKKAGVELTDVEFDTVRKMAAKVKADYDAVPVGLSFAEGYDPKYVASMQKFFDESGITAALLRSGQKVRFGSQARKTGIDLFQKNSFDYFTAKDRAWTRTYGQMQETFVINRNRWFTADSDLHELGHVVDRLVTDGHFGEQHRAEWSAFKAKVEKFAASSLTSSAGAKLTLDVFEISMKESGERVEMPELERTRAHYLKVNEVAAQTFQGYMMTGKHKWKSWVETNFPTLHKFFTKMANLLRRENIKQQDDALDFYSPLFREGRDLLSGLFDGQYAEMKNLNKELRKTASERGMSGRVLDAFSTGWFEVATPAAHEALVKTYDRFMQDNSGELSVVQEQELIDVIENVRMFNRTIGDDGMVSAEQAAWSMPWMRKLRTQSMTQFMNLRDALLRAARPAEAEKLTEIFGTTKGLQWVQENLGIIDPETISKVNQFMSQKLKIASILNGMTETIGEFLAEGDAKRPKAYQVYEQLMAVDAVARDWMLGRLEGKQGRRGKPGKPGQDGRPMYDKFTDLPNVGEALQDSTIKQRHQFRTWFPILHDALQQRVKRKGKVSTTDIYADGTFTFGEPGKRKKPKELKKFVGEMAMQDAAEYAATLQQSTDFANYYVYPDPVKGKDGKVRYVKIRVKEASHTNLPRLNAMQDEAYSLQQHAQTLIDLHNVEDSADPYGDAQRAYNETLTKTEETFLRENKSMFLRQVGEVVPRMVYEELKSGKANSFMMSELEIMTNWLKSTVGQPRQAFYSFARSIGMKDNITPLTLARHWLEMRMNFPDPKYMNHILAQISDSSGTLYNFVRSLDSYGKKMTVAMLQDSAKAMDAGQLPVIDPSERGKEAVLSHATVMNNKQVAKGVAPVLGVLPGGVSARAEIAKVTKRSLPLRILGKPFKIMEDIMSLIGMGPIHRAMANPAFSWLNSLHVEVGEASGNADRATADLWVEGKLLNDPTVDNQFVAEENAAVDYKSAIMQIIDKGGDVKKRHDDIIRLEQVHGMKLARMLTSDDALIKTEAEELLKTIPPEELEMHKEALERRYAANLKYVHTEIRSDIQYHILSFANILNLQGHFRGDAKAAERFAKAFRDVDSPSRVEMLVAELKMDAEYAGKIVESFNKVEFAMQQKHLKQVQHPENVTEKRMRNYHVSVVFDPKQKEHQPYGYFDFDDLAEAQAFIARMKSEGHKVPNQPKDYRQAQANYKRVTGSIAETTTRVIEARKMMIQFMLAGKLPVAEIEQVTGVLDGTANDIIAEEEAASLNKRKFEKRKFVEGRENLDMLEQYINSVRARTAANARRLTDLTFQLYRNDASSLNNPEIFQEAENFKKGIRQKDSETQKAVGKVGFTMFMGLNMSSGIIEIFQAYTTLTPILLEQGASVRDALMIPTKHWMNATKAAGARIMNKSDDSIWSNPEHLAVIREAERQGRLHQRRHHDISESRLNDVLDRIRARHGESSKTNQVLDKTFGFFNKTYGFFNRINAELSLASTYDILRKQRFGNKTDLLPQELRDLQNDAMRLSDVANGSLQRLGRPKMFNAPDEGLRNVASAYWSLQSFANAQVLNQIRMMRKWVDSEGQFTPAERKQAGKALTTLFGFQFMGMGVMGFTLMPAITKLVEQAFGFDMEDELKDFLFNPDATSEADKHFLGELAANGLLTAADVPLDYGTRISIAGIGPLSGFEGFDPKQLGGPIVGLASSAFRDMKKVKSGDMTGGEAALNLLPMGLRRGIRLEFFDDGKVYDANKKYMFTPDAGERIGMWLGFNSLRAREEMKARTERREAADSDMRRRHKYKNEILDALESRSIATMQQLLQKGASEFNTDVPTFARSVINLAADKKFGQSVREGTGPASAQAARLYPRETPPTETARLTFTQQMAQQMGVPIRIRPETFRNAQRRDFLRTTKPGLLTSHMNQMIENPLMRQTIDDAITPASSLSEFLQGAGLQ
jgi:hypothetical protein